MKFSIKDFSSKCHPNQQDTADLVKFTGEILNGKLYFFLEWQTSWKVPHGSINPFRSNVSFQ